MQYLLGKEKKTAKLENTSEPTDPSREPLLTTDSSPPCTGPAGLTKDDVLRWLLQDASHEDAKSVLGALEQDRPDVVQEVFPGRTKVKLKPSSSNVQRLTTVAIQVDSAEEELVQNVLATQKLKTRTEADRSVVQFAAEYYYVTEGEENVVLTLLRIGHLKGTCSVSYETQAISAVAGVNFEDAKGTVTFVPDQAEAQISVRIFDNDQWSNTMEFMMVLLPQTCQGCIPGQFMSGTRVKVIDDDVFPSNRCREAIMQEDASSLGLFTLWIDYVRLCWADPVIWSGSVKMFLVDLLHIIHNGLKLLINAYIVDRVFKNEDLLDTPDQAKLQLLVCAMLMLLPTGLLHMLDFKKPGWKVPGRCRAFLQNALFRKFLDHDDNSRAAMQPGSTIMAVTRDVNTVVENGYLSSLSLAKSICSVVGLVVFKLIGNRLFGVELSPTLIISLVAFPVIILPFVVMRKKFLADLIELQAEAQDEIANTLASSVDGFRLMTDYHTRSAKADEFSQSILSFNKVMINLAQVASNNAYYVNWIGALVTAVYTVMRGAMVVHGDCPLGIYLMDIQIFHHMNAAFANVFQVLISIISVRPALEWITHLLNLPTRLGIEKNLNRARLSCFRGDVMTHPDELKIRLRSVKFAYTLVSKSLSRTNILNLSMDGDFELEQGQMVAITGPPGQGKTTLLKLLAGVLVNSDDDIKRPSVFVPSHLRVLHVTVQPLFVFGTLLENLTYGIAGRHDMAGRHDNDSLERVRTICRKLGVEDRAIYFLDSPAKMKWSQIFSNTQQCLLNLARALVFDPEILCINYPAMAFSQEVRVNVFMVLREWVSQRGLELDDATWQMRRPRTCLYTVSGHAGVLAADKVLNISANGLQLLETQTYVGQSGFVDGDSPTSPTAGTLGD